MNIKDAKQEIIHTILAYTAKNEWGGYAIPQLRQRPLLLIGPPGIGKTAVMEQAAASCGVGFVSYTMTHHTRQSAIGLPFIEHRRFDGREYDVTEYTMSEIIASVYCCMEESGCREGLLFLDEINCVSETLAPAMLQFLQNKTFGSHRLPEGWVLAAAGNPQEYNKSVRDFDIATLDRLKYITVEADYDAWRPYALESGIHGAVLSYLDAHPQKFYILEQSYSSKAFVTARGWEDLSCLLLQYEDLQLPVTSELVGQYLHQEELSRDFSGYYHWFESRKECISVPDMLNGNEDATLACRTLLADGPFEEKLQLVHLMLSCLGTQLRKYHSTKKQLKLFQDTLDRLERYAKMQNMPGLADALPAFLEKEQSVLAVRREHGLSSEQEIRESQRMLYEFQTLAYQNRMQTCDLRLSLQNEQAAKKDSLSRIADRLLLMLRRCIDLLEPNDGAEFTVFLSSWYQNPLALSFLKEYPSEDCERCRGRLEFAAREEVLKQKLRQS